MSAYDRFLKILPTKQVQLRCRSEVTFHMLPVVATWWAAAHLLNGTSQLASDGVPSCNALELSPFETYSHRRHEGRDRLQSRRTLFDGMPQNCPTRRQQPDSHHFNSYSTSSTMFQNIHLQLKFSQKTFVDFSKSFVRYRRREKKRLNKQKQNQCFLCFSPTRFWL
jgi:hypothetical protein